MPWSVIGWGSRVAQSHRVACKTLHDVVWQFDTGQLPSPLAQPEPHSITLLRLSRERDRHIQVPSPQFGGQKLSKENPDIKVGHDMPAQYIPEMLAKLKETGVTAVSYGVTDVGTTEASARKVFDFAKKVGLENVVAEPKVDMALFATLDKLCNEYQINLAMHDHPKPSTYWNPETVLKVSEGRSKRIGSCSDTGHWYRSGLVPVDCIKQLNGRIIELHLKDINEKKTDVPWGTGVVNAKGIMEALAAQHPTNKPVFFIEYESSHGTDLANNVGKCCENFSKYCEELAK
jgi:sugar phosphate isomerase/epimerase